jgi:hypothetical protein
MFLIPFMQHYKQLAQESQFETKLRRPGMKECAVSKQGYAIGIEEEA